MSPTLLVLAYALGAAGLASAAKTAVFEVNEPVSVAGTPPVTLGPGSYVLRTVNSSGGAAVVQVLSRRQDYVYTTVLTIPAERPYPDDTRQILFSESPSGHPPALHYWFPPGATLGREFIAAVDFSIPNGNAPPQRLQVRTAGGQHRTDASDLRALNDVMLLIESGRMGAARDRFRRNYFLAQSRDGAFTSFLLALLMTDREEALASLDLVRRLDSRRARVMSRLDVEGVVDSLPAARSNLKASWVRRFLLNLALEMTDDAIARSAIVSFERHVVKGDSFPVEIALDRRREEQWVLAAVQVARLNDCAKSLLSKVGALEYTAVVGHSGSMKLTVVLTRRRLSELDVIMERSRRAICERHTLLERLISQRNAAIARELDALRSALREVGRGPGSPAISQLGSLRSWESASAAAVSRDLMVLAEIAASPAMRPSSLAPTDRAYVQIGITASLARLAEWIAF